MEKNIIKNNIMEALNLDIGEISGSDTLNCAVISSGCKLNQFESSQFEEMLRQLNINIVKPDLTAQNKDLNIKPKDIQLFLLNTCSVTEKADIYTNRIIRKIRRNYPECRLILTGCSAELNKKDFSSIPNTKLIDNTRKARLLKAASEILPNTVLNQNRARPYLKIQEGCETKCSFCIIPKARPDRWSLDIKDVLNSVKGFDSLGYKEVILTGVNIGSYGISDETQKDKNGRGLKELLKRIEDLNISVKIRISSIDPLYIDDELIEILANSKNIQNHFHIPLQSASDKILSLMDRHYNFEYYTDIIRRLTDKIKDVAIGTDIISGFPTESKQDFLETVNNLNKLPVYYIHAFSYSDRSGTEASFIKPKVNGQIIKQRTNEIIKISLQKKIGFHLKFKNKPLEFLSIAGGKAISSNYIKAKLIEPGLTIPKGKLFMGKIIETEDLYTKDEVLISFNGFI